MTRLETIARLLAHLEQQDNAQLTITRIEGGYSVQWSQFDTSIGDAQAADPNLSFALDEVREQVAA